MSAIVEIDPRHLVPHERNLRAEVGDLAELRASIEAVGILQPLVVIPTDPDAPTDPAGPDDGDGQRFGVIIGHRRRAAAIELGLPSVPCVVAAHEGAAQQIVTMLAENVHRVGLSVTEEADAYAQLALLDWNADQIAKVTARPITRVRNALALTSLPEAAREAADTGALTLEHAAELNDFRDDPKALARILKKGTGWGFKHALGDERRKRDRKTALERLRAELVLAGVKIIPTPKGFGYGATKEAEACTLLDRDGKPVDPEAVKSKPGFAAILHAEGSTWPRVVIVCTDPEGWGYTRTRDTGYVTDTQKAQRVAEQAAAQARREALAAAAEVRQEFLRGHYGTARSAKRAYTQALRDAVADPSILRYGGEHAELADALAGIRMFPTVATAGVDRLVRMLVARWVCGHEHNLHRVAANHRLEVNPQAASAYLDGLVTAGYTLSEAEQQLRDELTDPDGETASDANEGPAEDGEAETDDDASGDSAQDRTPERTDSAESTEEAAGGAGEDRPPAAADTTEPGTASVDIPAGRRPVR